MLHNLPGAQEMPLRGRPRQGDHRSKVQPEDCQMKQAVKGLGPAEDTCWHPGSLRDSNTGSLPRLPVLRAPGHWVKLGAPLWLSAPSTSGCGSRVTVKGAAGRGERAGALLIAAHPAWLGEGEPAGIPAGTSRRLGSLVDQRNQ